ncbi:MAG: master DNA invertase Mpi family serine-type recombinase [Spirochaetota bacterium]|jgi:DNA invertase Pin-like site-specific DNA recombinase|nr:master DNA invertase Mpi family serine-type recombinase [Spirochaetota bacterium]
MTYGYVRVSTDKQRVDNQEYEIERFCVKTGLKIDVWVKETISGLKEPEKRKLGGLLEKICPGDLIICSELSRLGRSLFMIMDVLNHLMKMDARVWTIKDNYRLGDDIQSKVLAFAFGLSAEIERNLISQRTKEALALKVAQGVHLGRPFGRKSSYTKLTGREKEIQELLLKGTTKTEIGRLLGVHRMTVDTFIKNHIKPPKRKKHKWSLR